MTVLEETFPGYTFETTIEPNNTGNKITCTAYNDKHEAVTSSSSCYGNGTGYGYAKMFAVEGCKENLQHLIDTGFKPEPTPEIDTEFLNRLANDGYITDYGELKSNDETVIMFDGWHQVEGEDEREYIEGKGMVKTGNFNKSVYAKLRELAEKNLLKPSINYTILNTEYVFTDEYMRCDECGKICHTTWDGIHYVEATGEFLCDDCLNDSDEAIEAMIEEAKEDFQKALPVGISEDAIERLGYIKVDEDIDFSTRYSQWGEKSWGCHNVPLGTIEEACREFDGFAKLTGVWQFDCEFNLYFPEELVDEAREYLGLIEDSEDGKE